MANLTFMNHTIFDHGATAQLGQVLMQHGIRRPLLCTDKGLVNLGMVTDLAANLGNDAALQSMTGPLKTQLKIQLKRLQPNISKRGAMVWLLLVVALLWTLLKQLH